MEPIKITEEQKKFLEDQTSLNYENIITMEQFHGDLIYTYYDTEIGYEYIKKSIVGMVVSSDGDLIIKKRNSIDKGFFGEKNRYDQIVGQAKDLVKSVKDELFYDGKVPKDED